MFSRFYSNTRTFFSRNNSSSSDILQQKDTPSGQAQEELKDAVNDAMVTTRRQEHQSRSSSLVDGLETNSPRLGVKRKARNNVEDSPNSEGKRRRTASTSLKHTQQEPIEITTDGEPSLKETEKQKLALRPHDSDQLDPESSATGTKSTLSAEQYLGDSQDVKGSSLKGGIKKSKSTALEESSGEQSTAVPIATMDRTANEQKPKHTRFGSEDSVARVPETQLGADSVQYPNLTEALQTSQEKGNEDEEDEDAEDSDDEAPEAVTTSAGQAQARIMAAEAAKAAKLQDEAKKEKRRKRDIDLKQQANDAQKSKNKIKSNKGKKKEEPTETLAEQLLKAGRLPDELPLEILEARSAPRLPTPPPELFSKHKLQNKRQLLDIEQKPPKDIRKDGKIFRALADSSPMLPPKKSISSAALREAMLRGRKGTADKRKPVSRGFLRK